MGYSDKNTYVVFPDNFEEKIGFNKIKDLVKKECLFNIGAEKTDKVLFETSVEKIIKTLTETTEFKNICLNYSSFPTENYFDLREELYRIKTKGTFIETNSLLKLILSLETVNKIFIFFNKIEIELFANLKKLCKNYTFNTQIIKSGEKIIDKNGVIKDNASQKLQEVRNALKELNIKRDKKLNQIYNQLIKSAISPDSGITLRNGRSVIPVHAANKRQVNGFIYDESATGQTVFIEPTEVFTINNQIAEKINEEKKEIVKILMVFTDEARDDLQNILSCYNFLGTIDFIRAKALFSTKICGIMPHIEKKPFISWYKAYHPLLLLKNVIENKNTVPLSISLNDKQRILIISGPNAGGKSVCLKTVGLLQYMLQCGFLIPLSEESKAGIFNAVFMDIGDEQSLENDLSTYSSHLKNMKFFLSNADNNTLFLIDEMGSGTEPQIGGALSEAVLEQLYNQNAYGVITTHYLNLKMMSQKHTAISNAAMLFDYKNLQPLFELSIGEPGSSFAFEIAKNIGLSEHLISNAKSKINTNIADFESYYIKVKEKEEALEKRIKEMNFSDSVLLETFNKYQELLNNLEAEKNAILLQANKEAQHIIAGTNKKVEHLIKSIKESNAEKKTTGTLRKDLEDYKNTIKKNTDIISNTVHEVPLLKSKKQIKKVQKEEQKKNYTIDTSEKPLQKGDFVIINDQNDIGTIEELKDGQAFAVFGNMKIRVSENKLRRITNYKPTKYFSKKSQYEILNIEEKQKTIKPELDVRGKRTTEALKEVEDYINTAFLCNLKQVRIIHGKGDGILRKFIGQALKNNELASSFHDEHIDLGGQGITVVYLST